MRRVTDGSTVLQVKFSKVRIKWFAKVGRRTTFRALKCVWDRQTYRYSEKCPARKKTLACMDLDLSATILIPKSESSKVASCGGRKTHNICVRSAR